MRRIAPFIALIGLFICGCEDSDSSSTGWNKTKRDGTAASTEESVFPTADESNDATLPTELQKASDSNGATEATQSGGAGDQVAYGSLRWSYGGNGGGAAKTSASISGLSMSGSSLSYRWAGDTLSAWGLSDGDASALACLFVQNDSGAWVGGKFDWISTSRTSRNLENVFHGYSGWSLSGVPNPCNAAFVIISKDGKKRTNVITCSWKR